MKKSMIENLSIDEQKCEAAAQALNKAVLRIHYTLATSGPTASGPAASGTAAPRPAAPRPGAAT
jgi:hypothetical protein